MNTISRCLRSTLIAASLPAAANVAMAQPAPPAEPAPAQPAPEPAPAEPAPAVELPAAQAPPAEAPPAEPPTANPPPLQAAPAAPVAEPAPVEASPPAEEPARPAEEPAPPAEEPAAEPEPPPPFLPIRFGGSIWSRYEMRSGYQEHGLTHPRLHREGDYVVSRARLSLATTPVDVGGGVEISGTFAPQAAYTFGETGAPATIGDAPPVGIYEGYASVGTGSYRLDIGRFAMNYGDALVIGNLDWNEAGRAFNGGRIRVTPNENKYFIDFFATLITEGRLVTSAPFQGDQYFYGAYAGLGPLISDKLDLDFYLLAETEAKQDDLTLEDPMDAMNTADGERDGATELTLGARIKGAASILDYRAEAGLQFGKRAGPDPTFAAPTSEAVERLAYQIDAELGVKPVKQFRIGLEGLIASGDDPDTADKNEGYNQLYPTGHKFLGLMDIGGVNGARTNVASAVLHLMVAPADAWKILVDGHYFSLLEGPLGGPEGAEVDAQVLYTIGKGFTVRALYGVFLPNEGNWEARSEPGTAGDPMHYVEAQFGYYFQ